MLDMNQLEFGIKLAFGVGEDGGDSDEGAVELADAIVKYGSKADILLLPGPILIPGAPPVPSSANGAKATVQSAESGRAALESGLKAQFNAGDPTMMLMSMAIMTYVNTSFFAFKATAGHMATGMTAMASPPDFTPVKNAGLAGEDSNFCAKMMAGIIHFAFQTSIFNGAAVAADGGLGAVTGQKLM